ncbi:MAG: hypothetical protein KC443_23540, partial [Anaerolineales bacterium]|nr:hypothetical protein [Anaerolineales bacterium]
ETYRTEQLLVNADPAQYKMADDAYNVSLLAYLIDDLLLGRFAQMPLPGKMTPDDEQRHRQLLMGKQREKRVRLDVRNGR